MTKDDLAEAGFWAVMVAIVVLTLFLGACDVRGAFVCPGDECKHPDAAVCQSGSENFERDLARCMSTSQPIQPGVTRSDVHLHCLYRLCDCRVPDTADCRNF